MAIVSSYGTLTAIASSSPSSLSTVSTSGPFYDGYRRTYAQIYRTQPAVRTVVDFFSRNIAQLGLQAFRRVSDTDRIRLTDHPLPRLITRPNPSTTRYRFIESTVQDLGVYFNAFWLKVRGRQLGLVRLPAAEVSVKGGILPTGYEWTPAGASQPQAFAPTEIVHFRGYDPANPLVGLPPIETLRQVLAEEAAATDYRRSFWKNAARVESVISRPATAPKWTTEQRAAFRQAWQEFAGSRAGMTPVLEDGMELKAIASTFRDAEYIGARKLSREEVAAAYHVPLPMVGILDHATFSNIREQHKQLYQDCLGPWLVMLEEDIELQLVAAEFTNVDDVYLEFNIAEKLKGSFEEQSAALSTAVGRPYMTANEARSRLNLPRHSSPTADALADVAPGQGQAFGRSGPPAPEEAALRAVLGRFAARQTARLAKHPIDERASAFRRARWRQELAADLRPLVGAAAEALAAHITEDTFALLLTESEPWSSARLDAVVAQCREEASRA